MEPGQSALRPVEEEPKPGPEPAQILLLFTVELNVQEKVLRNRIATLKTARFVADGVNMEPGQSALRPVEEEPKPGPNPAQILLLFTVELNVQETALRLGHATFKTARFMAGGVNMEPGQSALRPVEEEPKPGPDPAQILLLFTVELNVQEKALRNRIATLKTARFMADGVNMEPGQSALRPVKEEPKPGPDPAQILLLFTVELNVQEKVLRNRIATLKTARFMADGVNMEPGQSALRPVEEEPKPGPEPAQILLLFTVELNVQEKVLRNRIATLKTARFVADGVNMEPGQSALRPVEEEPKPGPDPAQILLLFTVELNVQEKVLRNTIATLKTARFMADGVNMEPGQSAPRLVEEDPSHEPEPAQILPLLTVEKIVTEKTPSLKNATHKNVQLMAGGVASLNGQSAPRLVEEDPSHEPEPAQILPLLTVEKIVTEKIASLKNATNKNVQLMAGGVASLNGQSAPRLVEEDFSHEPEPAQILPLLTVEKIVTEKTLRIKNATHKNVQLMAGGVALLNGQSAPRLVEEDPSHEPEPAQSLPLLTVEKIVTEKTPSLKIATNKNVQLMAGGVASLNGQSAPRLVEEDPSHEPEPAQILPLLTVEKIVTEKTPSLKNATHKNVQLMAGGVASLNGQSAPRLVEEDFSHEPEPAQILPLLTVEKIVTEKTPSLKNATHKNVQLMAGGVALLNGQSAPRLVEEDPSHEPEPAQILPLLTVE